MEKYKRLLSDTFIFAIGSFGSKLILFFLVPLYTNYLTTSQYGTVELIDTIANLVMPITSMVIFDSVLRFTLDKNKEKNSVILNATIVYCLGSIVTLLITPLFGIYDGINEWKWVISLYVISYMAKQIFMTYIKAKEKTKMYVILGVGQTTLLALLNIVLLAFCNFGIYGYLFSNISAHFIIAFIALTKGDIIYDLKKAHFDKELFWEMIKYSSPLIINNLSWWIIQSSDKMMVDFFMQSTALGLYSVANKIPALINVITSFFSQAWGISSIKEYDSTQDKEFYAKIFSIYSFIIFLVCALLLLIIKPFMKIYVGSNFFEAWKYVPWLLVAASFSAISAYFGGIYGALKKNYNVMISTFLSATINILLNLMLIQKIGILGATISTAISYLFISLYRVIDTRRFFKFNINFYILFIEYLIISINAYLVTIDKMGYLVSLISIIIIIIINHKTIINLIKHIKLYIRKRKGRGI